jgi:hypothetical protein
MQKTTRHSISAVTTIVTSLALFVVGTSSITQASAVVDVSKISAVNQPFGFSFPTTCGGDFIQGTFSYRQISVSDTHFTGQAVFIGQIYDTSTGQIVGRATNPEVFIINSDGLPTTQSVQQVITCIGSGQVSAIHYGFTIDEQSNFHVHA